MDSGDLWVGFIENDDASEGGPTHTLNAYRCAPLAQLVEENTSPASTGLHDVAVTDRFVYARYARMGGSGWGATIRFQRPPPIQKANDGGRELPSVDERDWKPLQRICGSVEQLADSPCAFLCVSTDRSLVFFANPYSGSDAISIVHHDGKPVTTEIKGLAVFFK